MDAPKNMKLFAVIGDPVLHSLSPRIHNAAFAQAGIAAHYLRLRADSAAKALEIAKELGLTGINVTAPYKEEVALLADTTDLVAARLGAVNTALIQTGRIDGFNTDVFGVSQALTAAGIKLSQTNALVLGTGSAAKAALEALLSGGAKTSIWGRDAKKARSLVCLTGALAVPVSELETAVSKCSLLISCLSTTDSVLNPLALTSDLTVMDAQYLPESELVRAARLRGCRIIDGREWLLYQGARAFELFTGQSCPLRVMHEALYSENKSGPRRHIAIIGMPGSGKSSVARELSAILKIPVHDCDDKIEKREGRSIREIFAAHGEEVFRTLEEAELTRAVDGTPKIIATGGGSVLSAANRKVLEMHSRTVWLWAKPETLAKRLENDGLRPLLTGTRAELKLAELLSNRINLYARCADLVISAEPSPRQTAQRSADEIRKAG